MAPPLTKKKRTGEFYTRPSSVERNIDDALAQDSTTIRRRLEVTDRSSQDYLSSECLVHLARHFTRLGEIATRDTVVWELFERCAAILNHGIDSRIPNADDLREEVLQEFAVLLANDGTGECPEELDYYECKFNRAFACFRIDMLRSARGIHRFSPLPRESADSDDSDGRLPTKTEEAISCPATQLDGLARDEMLNALPDEIREAVVLCHEMGYEVESHDPEKVTAATLCKVSGRTIRSRLLRAKELLSRFNEEEE
jgi:hypothetical protein